MLDLSSPFYYKLVIDVFVCKRDKRVCPMPTRGIGAHTVERREITNTVGVLV